jgi:hypothetical protein
MKRWLEDFHQLARGQLEFEARGFVQRAHGGAVVSSQQLLRPAQRSRIA